MIEEVKKHPQCNHKEMKCSCMEKRDGTCLLRNPFDCPFELNDEAMEAELAWRRGEETPDNPKFKSDEEEHTSALHEAQKG